MENKSLVADNSTPENTSSYSISFGDTESVMSENPAEYLGVFYNEWENYYEPPVSRAGLAKLFLANTHHSSSRSFFANMLCKFFKGSDALSYLEFRSACIDYASFGEMYFQRINNAAGYTIALKHQPTLNMRKGKNGRYIKLISNNDPIRFKKDEIIQLNDYDIMQKVYGWPPYMALIQSVILNESATLFRRRYYVNNAMMGYIFFTNDPDLPEKEKEKLKNEIKNSKGVGNFKSMFIHAPNGSPDSVKLIPVGDKATQDNFADIKRISQNDILAAWRMPGELAGVQPEDKSGRGDAIKAAKVYVEMEILPLLPIFEIINQYLPRHLRIRFDIPKTGVWDDD
ncbi:phage portal protein [Pseudomonas sp. HK3]